MPSVLITGSNRGLGLEWVRQYAAEGWKVFAKRGMCSEEPSEESILSLWRNFDEDQEPC